MPNITLAGDDDDKEKFLAEFSELRPDLFFPEAWTTEQRAQAADLIRPQRTKTGMLAAIPMGCEGPRCVYAQTCPLLAVNLAPVGKPCPIEMAMVSQFFGDYMVELGVDGDNLVEVSMVRDLVDQEVQYMRKTKVLAQEHFIQENVVGVDQDGKIVTKKELHQAVEFEDRIHRRKEKLRQALLATREARAKVGQASLDTAQAISKILDDVRKMESEKDKALKKMLGTFEQDDYIDAHFEDADVVEESPLNPEED